jgi:RHS repeat-associated protein
MASVAGPDIVRVDYQFVVDETTGSARAQVAVPATAARALTPQLVLQGGGGGGNSIVGLGWSLGGLGAITIDTSEHLPRWDGRDTVALGGDGLVVWRNGDGTPRRRTEGDYTVTDLRPRAGFTRVRVEEWRHRPTGDVHYRSRSDADVLTIYGARSDGSSRIADPDEPTRVATWLPELVLDADGNALWCEYAAEDMRGVDRGAPWEPRQASTTQRYLTRIRYGNVAPVTLSAGLVAGEAPAVRFAFALVIDHGDHGAGDTVPTFAPDRAWPAREDAFSSARDGFVVRTYRRVRRIACFHDIPALDDEPLAVSALEFEYDELPGGARLASVRRLGYRDGVVARSAALTITYADAGLGDEPTMTATPVPQAARHQLVDLYGEGLPGVLYQGERGWWYRANRGGGQFAEPTMVSSLPNFEQAALTDVNRDGDTELAVTSGRLAGSFTLEREDAQWTGYRPFARWPHIEALAGRTFWVDLNGDGRPDAVIARGDSLVWFPSRTGPLDESDAEFDDPVIVPWPRGADSAPKAGPDPALDLYFADMNGDGLPDLVRVRRGAIEYWPSLGNGRFGERVVMDGAPSPGTDSAFDSTRVRWVGLDGSGTPGMLYVDDGELWYYPNEGGRRFGTGQRVRGLPRFEGRTASVADVAGDGRPALVWATTTAGRTPFLSYLPLVPPTPPGLLVAIEDGCGRRTELTWGNSAAHYLRDAAEDVPWETRLPSHRPVVDVRIERDLVGGTAVTTRYRYRDGFYDGATGAFRGFGRVETLDTPSAALGDPAAPVAAPALLTRTWFHLGTPMWNHHRPFEPYEGDALAPRLPAHVEAAGPLRPADAAAALRLLAGTVVRRERWAVDENERPVAHPFDVEQRCARLAVVQARHGAARPVFGVVPSEQLVATYEGVADDPRVTHQVVVAHDGWGTPTRTAEIAYARRGDAEDPAQERTWITITDGVVVSIDTTTQFVIGAPIESRRFELVGLAPVAGRIAPAALSATAVSDALAAPARFETALDPDAIAPAARRIDWQRVYYWNERRDDVAALGAIGASPRVHHREQAVLTSDLVSSAFGTRADDALVTAVGYVWADDHAWQLEPTQLVAGPFGLPAGTERGDGATTAVSYDDDWLAIVESADAIGLTTTFEVDYRTLAPALTVDPNENEARVAFDALGRSVAHGVEGHVGTNDWGSGQLGAWTPPAGATLSSILADPRDFLGTAASATWIDDGAWEERGEPVAIVSVARVALVNDGNGGGDAEGPLEVSVRYVDGFGRVLQEKTLVEPGLAITRDLSGDVVVDEDGPVLGTVAERWRVSGHVVYDAKGQPIRVFEPYFSGSAAYEDDAVLQQFGVSTLTAYDALGRPVRIDHPNGTYERVAYGAWSTEAASPSDTVLGSAYRTLREGLAADAAERVAYEHAASHADTPVITHVDARGTVCLTVAVGDATADERRVRQVVDASGQVVATIDPRGLTAFEYVRDMRGRALATTSVDAGASWLLFDAYDRPTRSWDAREHRIERTFDLADRPVEVHVYDGDGATSLDHVVETYTYGDADVDAAAARAANRLGRVVEVRDEAGVARMLTYDPAGAVRTGDRRLRVDVDDVPDWSGTVSLAAGTLDSASRNDALGRVVWQQFPDGTERRDVFHPGGALASVQLTTPDGALIDAPIAEGLVRDAHGRIAAAQLGNGCVQAWRYDRDTGRLVEQDADMGTRALQRLRFTYDPDGKIVRTLDLAQDGADAILDSAVSARRDFAYDAHGRLVSATGRVHQALLPHDYIPGTGGTISGTRHLSLNNGAALERYTQLFTYDVSGNLLSLQHAGTTASWSTDFWVADGSNRSIPELDPNGIAVADPDAAFDASGNVITQAHLRSMAWSWRGCLSRAVTIVRVAGTDDDERYAYGADRVRVRKLATRVLTGSVVETREVVYIGDQERVQVRRDGTLVLERWTTHVGDGERRVAVVDRHTVDSLAHEVDAIGPAKVRYHLTTPQGSTAIELDESGGIISYEEYLPHGGSAYIAGDDARDVARRDIRYAGQERDRATGLHAYPYRYYAPWMGRWLSPDPIGPEDDLNLYQFVLGDPIGNVDPKGLDTRATDSARPSFWWWNKEHTHYVRYEADDYGKFAPIERAPAQRPSLDQVNRFLDKNQDHLISRTEFQGIWKTGWVLPSVSGDDPIESWMLAMNRGASSFYRLDDDLSKEVAKTLRSVNTQTEPTAIAAAEKQNDKQLRMGVPTRRLGGDYESGNYTNESERAARLREIHKYEDPQRVVNTAEVGAAVIAPTAYALATAGKHGAEAIAGYSVGVHGIHKLTPREKVSRAFSAGTSLLLAGLSYATSGPSVVSQADDILNLPTAGPNDAVFSSEQVRVIADDLAAATPRQSVLTTKAPLPSPSAFSRDPLMADDVSTAGASTRAQAAPLARTAATPAPSHVPDLTPVDPEEWMRASATRANPLAQRFAPFLDRAAERRPGVTARYGDFGLLNSSGDDGYLATNLGGTNPIPPKTDVALGVGEHLEECTAQLREHLPKDRSVVHFMEAYEARYVGFPVMNGELFVSLMPEYLKAFTSVGGRVRLNLTDMLPKADYLSTVSVRELREVLRSDLLGKTDFYLDGALLDVEARRKALEPWQQLFATGNR